MTPRESGVVRDAVIKVLIALQAGLLVGFLSSVATGCYDGPDLKSTEDAPKPRLPDIGYVPDGGAQPASVETSASALIGSGMRSCYVAPEHGDGELTVTKDVNPPSYGQCLVLPPNQAWDLAYPALHYYDATPMNDNVRKIQGYVCNNKCLGVEVWSDWQFSGDSYLVYTCAPVSGCANLLHYPTMSVSSIQTYRW